ncbi:hypothetical protein [Pseudomonas wenzhouensis]|uniref:hypothetical protein n=1 Tax=Pseudomonas wenzhouensis TaxID=2906062 RepID=UPI001E4EF380|nr:hypothetical protein [Pseudomonas wenzhouensis]UFQ99272.1 hypothetical protein J7655_08960 [Pseudomonas wenzhouensis]
MFWLLIVPTLRVVTPGETLWRLLNFFSGVDSSPQVARGSTWGMESTNLAIGP